MTAEWATLVVLVAAPACALVGFMVILRAGGRWYGAGRRRR